MINCISDFDDRTPFRSAGDSCRVSGRRHGRARERSLLLCLSLSLSRPLARYFSQVVRRRRNPRVGHRTLSSVVRVLASSRRVGFAGKNIARTRGPPTPFGRRKNRNPKRFRKRTENWAPTRADLATPHRSSPFGSFFRT